MRIQKFKLKNYVCFYDEDAEDVELGPAINFIIGKNNSGKTALVGALNPRRNGEIHRSVQTVSRRENQGEEQNTETHVLELKLDKQELLELMRSGQYLLPISTEGIGHGRRLHDMQELDHRLELTLSRGFSLRCFCTSAGTPSLNVVANLDLLMPLHGNFAAITVGVDMDLNYSIRSNVTNYVGNSHLERQWGDLRPFVFDRIYEFHAERPVRANASPDQNFNLQSDAANLAQVLNSLKNAHVHFFYNDYMTAVRTILPSVEDVLTITERDSQTDQLAVNLRISQLESSRRREDLAQPLDKCGTGVGQILAMLYVVLFYDKSQPRVIIIDEPNSFLHPGAVCKLLEIFQEHDHHQYIIATHSPTAIMSVKKKRILLVTRENQISSVKSVNVTDNAEMEVMLKEIGSSRSDIFGMDAYIWVEGKTDKMCFDLIMDKHGGLPAGVEIIDLVHTGDFTDKKRGALIEQIYGRLSGSVGILPSVLAFVFDGDLQNDDFKETDTRKFLSRQNYESYLIVPDILADILNRDAADDKPKDHTADSVKQWIRDKESKEYDDPESLKSVDGAKLLDSMFQDLAGVSYENHKAAYGEEITKHILANEPNHFQEIVDLIKSILPAATT